MSLSALTTAESLWHAADALGRCELVRGEIVMMSPAGSLHGVVTARIAKAVGEAAEASRAGLVFAAETGFLLEHNPDTVRAPDVAFVRSSRVADGIPSGYFPGAPDFVVEVLSPNDRAADVAAKVADWLAAGTDLVWVVNPATRTLTAHDRAGTSTTFQCDALVPGGSVLPSLLLNLGSVFPAAAR